MSFRIIDPMSNLISSIYKNVPIANKIVYTNVNDGDVIDITLVNITYIEAFFNNASGGVVSSLNILNLPVAKFGDTLNLIFSRQNTANDVTVNLPEVFTYTTCGDLTAFISFNSCQSIFVPFVFDGNSFVNTFDNC